MMLYIRDEGEEWLLHLEVVRMIMTHNPSSCHVNYARNGYYLPVFNGVLTTDVRQHFLNEEKVK